MRLQSNLIAPLVARYVNKRRVCGDKKDADLGLLPSSTMTSTSVGATLGALFGGGFVAVLCVLHPRP